MDDVTAPRRLATFWVCGQGLPYLAKERNYCLLPGAFQILGWGSPKFRERNGVRHCEMEPLKVSEALAPMKCVWADREEVGLGLKQSSGPLGTT